MGLSKRGKKRSGVYRAQLSRKQDLSTLPFSWVLSRHSNPDTMKQKNDDTNQGRQVLFYFLPTVAKGQSAGLRGVNSQTGKRGKRRRTKRRGGWGKLGVKSTVSQKPAGSDLVGYGDKGFKLIWKAWIVSSSNGVHEETRKKIQGRNLIQTIKG